LNNWGCGCNGSGSYMGSKIGRGMKWGSLSPVSSRSLDLNWSNYLRCIREPIKTISNGRDGLLSGLCDLYSLFNSIRGSKADTQKGQENDLIIICIVNINIIKKFY